MEQIIKKKVNFYDIDFVMTDIFFRKYCIITDCNNKEFYSNILFL